MLSDFVIDQTLAPENPGLGMVDNLAESVLPDTDLDPEENYRRLLARKRMINFIQFTFPAYLTDPFHESVCDAIDRVVNLDHERPITHLMLNGPPQHGKSEIVSTRLTAFALAQNPDLPVALVSFSMNLAVRNSRNARGVFDSHQYGQLFGAMGIYKDQSNWRQKDWKLADRGAFVYAAGIDSLITGYGFGLVIVDDPIANWQAAQSETVQENTYDWWTGTMVTRMWEGCRVVFMMTRWSEDDLQAKILEREGRNDYCMNCNHYFEDEYDPVKCPECGGNRGKWFVYSYPAMAETQKERDETARNNGHRVGLPDILGREPGEALAPSRFSKQFLVDQRQAVGETVWRAEYQQHPSAPEGAMFKIRQIPVAEPSYSIEDFGGHLDQSYSMESEGEIDYRPVGVKNCVRFWDLAASEKKQGTDPDYTSGTLLGITKSQLVYVLHNVTLRGEPQQVLQLIRDTASLDGPNVKIFIEQEGGASGKALIKTWQRELMGYVMEGIPSTGDKISRAWPFAAQVNTGSVRLVKALWNGMWLANHRVFPYGKHDDIVDSTSGAFAQAAGGQRWASTPFRALGQ